MKPKLLTQQDLVMTLLIVVIWKVSVIQVLTLVMGMMMPFHPMIIIKCWI